MNRKRGAKKAAETRRAQRKKTTLYYCGVCGDVYEDETEESEQWIGCDLCDSWYHGHCVDVITEPDTYACSNCV